VCCLAGDRARLVLVLGLDDDLETPADSLGDLLVSLPFKVGGVSEPSTILLTIKSGLYFLDHLGCRECWQST